MGSFGGEHWGAHVLAIPYTTQGHIAPLLRLTTQLARKGVTVSFVCYEGEVPVLTAASSTDDDISSEKSSNLDSFRFITIPRLRPEEMVIKEYIQEPFEPLLQKLLNEKRAGSSGRPTCMISDAFLTFTLDVAKKLEIPRYAFVPSGVTIVRLFQGFLAHLENGQFQISEEDGKLVQFDWPVCISGLPHLRFHELPNSLRTRPAQYQAIAESTMQSKGVLVNSFLELEEKVLEESRSSGHPLDDEHKKVPKIYPIGPLFSTKVLNNSTCVGTSSNGLEDSGSKCLLWLATQAPSSVLYVAFGSQFRLNPQQIVELAHGLEASGQNFLWVIPRSKEEVRSLSEVLPPGFEARVGNRGCIVTGWTPQLQILAHSSTGGFMTHSGWNSSLESTILGVPMISWPQGNEQHLNCRYLVDEVKIAEQLQTGKDNILKRDEVERAVRLLMLQPKGAAMRGKVQELQEKAASAMATGGSRSKILEEVFNDMHGYHNVRELKETMK